MGKHCSSENKASHQVSPKPSFLTVCPNYNQPTPSHSCPQHPQLLPVVNCIMATVPTRALKDTLDFHSSLRSSLWSTGQGLPWGPQFMMWRTWQVYEEFSKGAHTVHTHHLSNLKRILSHRFCVDKRSMLGVCLCARTNQTPEWLGRLLHWKQGLTVFHHIHLHLLFWLSNTRLWGLRKQWNSRQLYLQTLRGS